jgi:hypothetical protein
MRDLLVLLHQVESFRYRRIVLVPILPDLEENFDHVLTPLTDSTLMQDCSESLEHRVVGFRAVFGQKEPDFTHESDGYFDGIVGRAVKTEEQDLEGDNLVCNILIAKVGNEGRSGVADDLQRSANVTSEVGGSLPCRYACRPF